jgi:amino acid permease
MSYWHDMNHVKGIFAVIGFLLIPLTINVLNTRWYGEVEFWLTSFKIVGIVVVILVGFIIAAGGIPSSSLLLGLDRGNYHPAYCTVMDEYTTQNSSCVRPGFVCESPFSRKL